METNVALLETNVAPKADTLEAAAAPKTPPASKGHAPLSEQLATLGGVILPFAGLVAAIALMWGEGFSWVELALLVSMYLATGLGITVGFHRLFTHRAFETAAPVKFALGVLGSMSVQGPLFKWVAVHRCHHQHSDKYDDLHSPHHYGGGFFGVIAGFWHAHIGWMFVAAPKDLARYSGDLQSDRLLRVVSNFFGIWAILGFVIPAAIGGLVWGSWYGALLGFLWGGVVRLFLIHHLTWSINSICHLWGQKPFKTHDESRNNFICGILALGEGWHNNHHAFPSSARHGLRWWEFDFSFLVIRCLEWMGLAWSVKSPAPHMMAAKRA